MKAKRMVAVLMACMVSVSMCASTWADEIYVVSEETGAPANITYPHGVTNEMTKASFWAERTYTDANKVMMSADEIREVNSLALNTEETYMHDLESYEGDYDASVLYSKLAATPIPQKVFYIDGELINNDDYFGHIKEEYTQNFDEGGMKPYEYAVCVKSTEIKDWPTNDILGYNATDTDDEIQSSSLTVNDPFVVLAKTEIDGNPFYWGYSNLVSGWVDGNDLAICKDKEEWLDAWKVDVEDKDIIVVTQDKIVLEPDIFVTYASEVKLKFGTILKLVDSADIPKEIGQRHPWHNYVVYLPTRNEEGAYEKKMALIPEHCKVSVGFLPLTQANLIDVSLQCLGNRYGWGGMLDSMDCSLLTRNVYRCFGFELPRNTTWQQLIPGTQTDLTGMDDETKQSFLETMPAGTLLYFRGHTMVYLGSVNHVGYVVSDLGTAVESDGPLEVVSVQGVTITPLTVRRGGGKTWLSELSGAVAFAIPQPEETTTEQATTMQPTTTEQTPTVQPTTTEQTTTVQPSEVTTVKPVESTSKKIIKAPKLTKATAKKKSLKINWKKVAHITGYKLQLATNKKFKKAKTIDVKSSKTSRFVKGLKKKKYYYIRIRSYQLVKGDMQDTIYYSKWSNVIKKKTR